MITTKEQLRVEASLKAMQALLSNPNVIENGEIKIDVASIAVKTSEQLVKEIFKTESHD